MAAKYSHNLYATLGVSPSANNRDIKAAFREKAKKFHPDVNPTATAHYSRIQEAYSVLNSARTRKEYDIWLQANRPAAHIYAPSYSFGKYTTPNPTDNPHAMDINAWMKAPPQTMDPEEEKRIDRKIMRQFLIKAGTLAAISAALLAYLRYFAM